MYSFYVYQDLFSKISAEFLQICKQETKVLRCFLDSLKVSPIVFPGLSKQLRLSFNLFQSLQFNFESLFRHFSTVALPFHPSVAKIVMEGAKKPPVSLSDVTTITCIHCEINLSVCLPFKISKRAFKTLVSYRSSVPSVTRFYCKPRIPVQRGQIHDVYTVLWPKAPDLMWP